MSRPIKIEVSTSEALAVLRAKPSTRYPQDDALLRQAQAWLQAEVNAAPHTLHLLITADEAWAVAHAQPGVPADSIPLWEVRRRLHVELTAAASREIPAVKS